LLCWTQVNPGAVTVSTGWRTWVHEAGRDWASPVTTRLKTVRANNVVPFARKAAALAA